MKQILLLFLLIPFFGIAQKDYSFSYSAIENIQGSRHELYLKSVKWIIEKTGGTGSITVADSTLGFIKANAFYFSGKGETIYDIDEINYTLEIEVKDNKVRIKTYDYYLEDIFKERYALNKDYTNLPRNESKRAKKLIWWKETRDYAIDYTNTLYNNFFDYLRSKDDW